MNRILTFHTGLHEMGWTIQKRNRLKSLYSFTGQGYLQSKAAFSFMYQETRLLRSLTD